MNHFETFFKLHHQAQPLLLGNAWDVSSAKIFESAGFKAIATSSAALANSLGYEDGEQIPFDLLIQTVKRIISASSIPVSVDIEGGFSRDIPGILRHIDQLHDMGAVGFNIEDSSKIHPQELQPQDEFREVIYSIRNHLDQRNMGLFINARTDGFLLRLPSALKETISRAIAYENAGASGIFVPFLRLAADMVEVIGATQLPVNVLCVKDLPPFDELASLGIKRISVGSSVYRALNRTLEKTLCRLSEDQDCLSLFA
jgi:2-methylisocitrate lyase-like PEP mutase family enzyme